MENLAGDLFILTLTIATAILLYWGCTRLYRVQWQMLAAVPIRSDGNGGWDGMNITFYGFFSANAYVAGAVLFIILNGSAGVPLRAIEVLAAIVLGACIPASSLIARSVEKKPSVFTVAGAFFTALLILPPATFIVQNIPQLAPPGSVSLVAVLAAAGIAYCFAAGIGALACISFGCCYGKPLAACSPLLQRIFANRCFVFAGATKKIAYAHNLATVPVIPVQGLTAIIYTGSALGACFLFLHGYVKTAFFTTVLISQGWRFVSEFFRADYRGVGRISAYQIMAIVSICYAALFPVFFSSDIPIAPSVFDGLRSVWRPDVIVLLQLLWVVIFFYTGCSRVTGSKLSFFVRKDRI